MRPQGPRHLWIPDTQVKPGVPTDHIAWAGRYAGVKRPDRIFFGGDWWDMPSLSSYDKGKRAAEGKRIKLDVDAGNAAMDLFFREMRKTAPRSYAPDLYFVFGNHEYRIEISTENDPALDGLLSLDMLALKKHGIKTSPFLKPIEVDGITYVHYCPIGANGRVVNGKFGAPNARVQAQRMMRTTVCGHKQGKDLGEIYTPGRTIRGVIAGSFYQHEEKYLTPIGETYWRGILVFNDVQARGAEPFDLCEVSMDYLRRRFG